MAIGLVATPGKGGLLDRLKTIFRRTQDLSPLAPTVKTILFDANQERAAKGLDYTGRAYAPLSKRTLEDRRKEGAPAGPPLSRHGASSRIVTGCEITVQPQGSTMRITKSWPDVAWMEDHITGVPGRRLPQRDPLGWGKEELTEVRLILPKYVTLGKW